MFAECEFESEIFLQVGLERELDRCRDVRRDARHRSQQVHCQPQRQQKHDRHQAKILAKCYGSHSSTSTGLLTFVHLTTLICLQRFENDLYLILSSFLLH